MTDDDFALRKEAAMDGLGYTCESNEHGFLIRNNHGELQGHYSRTEKVAWERFLPNFLTDPIASDLLLRDCDRREWAVCEWNGRVDPSDRFETEITCRGEEWQYIWRKSARSDTRYRARLAAYVEAVRATKGVEGCHSRN